MPSDRGRYEAAVAPVCADHLESLTLVATRNADRVLSALGGLIDWVRTPISVMTTMMLSVLLFPTDPPFLRRSPRSMRLRARSMLRANVEQRRAGQVLPAVTDDHAAGDVVGQGRCEEYGRLADVVHRSHAAQWITAQVFNLQITLAICSARREQHAEPANSRRAVKMIVAASTCHCTFQK